eukprot:7121582-Pyramimonas_sp.AAC.1
MRCTLEVERRQLCNSPNEYAFNYEFAAPAFSRYQNSCGVRSRRATQMIRPSYASTRAYILSSLRATPRPLP